MIKKIIIGILAMCFIVPIAVSITAQTRIYMGSFIASGFVQSESHYVIKDVTAPGTPPSGYGYLYVNSDTAYFIDDNGVPSSIIAGAGGGDVDQNLWETISADSGSTAANTITDTLTIAGGTNVTTAISGDTVTITASGGGSGDYEDGGEVGGADRTLGNTDTYDLGFLTDGNNVLHLQSDGNIGINETAPETLLHLSGESASITQTIGVASATAGHAPNLVLRSSTGTLASPTIVGAGNDLGEILAKGYDGNSWENATRIRFEAEGTPADGSMGGRITLWTTPDASTTLAERMRIDDGGNVGIGTSAPGSLLEVQAIAGAAGTLTLTTAETTVVNGDILGQIDFQAPLEASGTDAILVSASIWAEADDTFAPDNNDTDLVFATGLSGAVTEKLRIDSAGNMTIVGGVSTSGGDGTHHIDLSNTGAYTGGGESEGWISYNETTSTMDLYNGADWNDYFIVDEHINTLAELDAIVADRSFVSAFTDCKGGRIESPVVEDLDKILYFMQDITVTRVWCITDAGTVTLNIENDSGTDILSADIVCDVGEQTACASGCDVDTVQLAQDNIAAFNNANISISATASSPTVLNVYVGYTID